MIRLAAAALAVVALGACFAPAADVTESGKGLPQVSVDFPSSIEAGSTQTLRVGVSNPGPGDIEAVFVAFGLVAVGGQQGNALPLVRPGPNDDSPSIVGVEPRPVAVSQGGVVYRFGSLDTGRSATLRFEIRASERPGPYANSLQVYDGADLERIRGVRLQTDIAAS